MVKPIIWDDTQGVLRMLDQRKLPMKEEWVVAETGEDVAKAIKDMVVRGAPLLGIVGVFGLVLAASQLEREGWDTKKFLEIADKIRSARPTAVNLRAEVDAALEELPLDDAMPFEIRAILLERAKRLLVRQMEEDMAMARHGLELFKRASSFRVMTICNTGALATGGYGTALGVIKALHEAGKLAEVFPLETRPFLQGARLTVYELEKDGIPYRLIVDSASAITMKQMNIRAVFVGADRIAANGDTANKIGTFMLALEAHHIGVPFFVVAPTSTFDLSIASGDDIPIEERSADEVRLCGGQPVTIPDASVYNPVFDVTPHRLITAIITEKGVIWHPSREAVAEFFGI